MINQAATVVCIRELRDCEDDPSSQIAITDRGNVKVPRHQYRPSQLAAYIPAGAINKTGRLSFPTLYYVDSGFDVGHPFMTVNHFEFDGDPGFMHLVEEGDDVSEVLGLTFGE